MKILKLIPILLLLLLILSCEFGEEILAPNYGKIFVVNNNSYEDNSANSGNTVTVIRGRDKKVLKILKTGESYIGSAKVVVNPVNRKVYVINSATKLKAITVFDGDSHDEIGVIANIYEPSGIALNSLTNRIYAISKPDGKMYVIDSNSDRILEEIDIGKSINPEDIAVNPKTNMIYVLNNDKTNFSYTVINGETNVVKHISNSSFNNPEFIAVNPKTNKIYVSNKDGNTVTIIDGKTNKSKDIFNFNAPAGIAFSLETNKVYVANSKDAVGNSITIIDSATDSILDNIPIEKSPWAIAVNDFANEVYITCTGDSKLIILDNLSDKITKVISGFSSPKGVAYLP